MDPMIPHQVSYIPLTNVNQSFFAVPQQEHQSSVHQLQVDQIQQSSTIQLPLQHQHQQQQQQQQQHPAQGQPQFAEPGHPFNPNTSNQNLVLSDDVQRIFAFQSNPQVFFHQQEQVVSLKNYILGVLNKTWEGRFQLKAYHVERTPRPVTDNDDGELFFSFSTVAKLIINNEVDRLDALDVTNERIIDLAQGASEVFNCERSEFYLPAANGRGIGGTLVKYLQSLRSRQAKLEKKPKLQGVKRKKNNSDTWTSDFITLSTLKEIDEKYMVLWSKTLEERRLFYNRNGLNAIFDKFPGLLQPSGFKLVQADYLVLYQNNPSVVLDNSLRSIFENIIITAKKSVVTLGKQNNIKNAGRVQCMTDLLHENADIISDDHLRTVALSLLPYLFKKINKVPPNVKKNKAWHPEQSEILGTFIIHVKNDKDREYELKKAFEKVRSIHNDHTLLIGPFIVIIGPNLWDISSAYVCIDAKIRFELPSCATAVQFCVKFMKCFNKKYSSICNHVWESIEITLFNFKYDHPSCAVSDVIKKINPQKTQLNRSKESTDVRTEMMENVQ